MADQQELVAKKLLGAAIDKSVSERLGTYMQEVRGLTKRSMTGVEVEEAGFMVLGMIEESCKKFCAKMRERLEAAQAGKRI